MRTHRPEFGQQINTNVYARLPKRLIMRKLQTKRTKQGQQKHITKGLKGWINLLESKDVLKIDKDTAMDGERVQMLRSFIADHSNNDLFLISSHYLQAHRRSIKAYYSKMGSMFKNFALPLTTFYYCVLYERMKALSLKPSDFFFSRLFWPTHTADRLIYSPHAI